MNPSKSNEPSLSLVILVPDATIFPFWTSTPPGPSSPISAQKTLSAVITNLDDVDDTDSPLYSDWKLRDKLTVEDPLDPTQNSRVSGGSIS